MQNLESRKDTHYMQFKIYNLYIIKKKNGKTLLIVQFYTKGKQKLDKQLLLSTLSF